MSEGVGYSEQCHDWDILSDLRDQVASLTERMENLVETIDYLVQKDETEKSRMIDAMKLHDFYMGRKNL